MSLVKASLLALALLVLPQPGAGPDELAELFPADTMIFAELNGIADLLRDWKDYAGAYVPAAKRKELLEKLEKSAKEGQEKLPEKLFKDLEKGAPSLRRLALAFRTGSQGPEWAVAASSSDPAFFKKIVEEDLRVFAAMETSHAGVPVLDIRKLGELRLPEAILVAAAGGRLLVTSDPLVMTQMIDRALGKGAAGTDLRANPIYGRFAPAPEGASLRAFSSGFGNIAGAFSGMGRRNSAHEFDKVNALFGLDKVGGFRVEASFKPGKITSVARLGVGTPCPLYDLWRQPAGPKDLLKFVPDAAAFVAHVNATSGKDVWAGVERLMTRYDEIEASAGAERPGRPRRAAVEEANREFERELGLSPKELLGAIGNEAALALVGPNAFAFNDQMFGALLFVVKAVDPAGAKAALLKLSGKLGAYQSKEEGGALFLLPPADRAGQLPVFALQGSTCLMSGSQDTIAGALAVAGSGRHFAATLPADAARASKLVSLDLGAVWTSMMAQWRGDFPEELRALEFDSRSLVTLEEKADEVELRTSDGAGLALQAGWLSVPAMFTFATSRRMRPGIQTPPAPAPLPLVPALPPAEVASKVKALVSDLQADDVVKREEAAAGLRALGPQAIRAVVDGFKASSDAETRGRLLGLLVEWKAYDAMPEVLTKKVEAFLEGFRRAPNPNEPRGYMGGLAVQWYRHEGMTWSYCMEPSWVDEGLLRSTAHLDVLQYPVGAKAAAAAASGERTPVEQRKRIASILAYVDCGKAGAALVTARDGAADPEVKGYLQIALGWSEDPACRKAVIDGLKEGDLWTRRSSFIAAERSTDPALIDVMIGLLKNGDPETRWNAGYTLKAVTRGQIVVNPYAPAAEVEAAHAAAAAWWASNRASFKPGK